MKVRTALPILLVALVCLVLFASVADARVSRGKHGGRYSRSLKNRVSHVPKASTRIISAKKEEVAKRELADSSTDSSADSSTDSSTDSSAAAEESQICQLSTKEAAKPLKLRFCKQYRENACCLPGNDDENRDMFEQLVDVGKGCHRYVYHEIRQLFCIGCSPDQPKFTAADGTVRICRTFADKLFPKTPNANKPSDTWSKYDECGLLGWDPCEIENADGTTAGAPGDPYDCGDGLYIPSAELASAKEGGDDIPDEKAAEWFMALNYIKPPGFDDNNFVVVPDGPDCFNSASGLATSAFTVVMSVVLAVFLF